MGQWMQESKNKSPQYNALHLLCRREGFNGKLRGNSDRLRFLGFYCLNEHQHPAKWLMSLLRHLNWATAVPSHRQFLLWPHVATGHRRIMWALSSLCSLFVCLFPAFWQSESEAWAERLRHTTNLPKPRNQGLCTL